MQLFGDPPVVFQLQLAMWSDDELDDDSKLRHSNAPAPKRRVTPTSKPDDRRFARKEVELSDVDDGLDSGPCVLSTDKSRGNRVCIVVPRLIDNVEQVPVSFKARQLQEFKIWSIACAV